MNYETLKAAVANVIKTNGNEEITGQILQDVLVAIINSLGADYQFAGVATPATDPGTLDQRVFYIASAVGEVSFPNFGPLTIEDEICILKWDSAWSVEKVIDLTAEATEDNEALITSGGVYAALQTLAQQVENALADLEEEVSEKIDKSDAETLAVGSAQGILAQSAVDAFFTYRETPARGAGAALIQTIKGKTIAWNQLMEHGNFDSLDGWYNSNIISIADNVATITPTAASQRVSRTLNMVAGHKYYFALSAKAASGSNVNLREGNDQDGTIATIVGNGAWQRGSVIYTAANTSSSWMGFSADTTSQYQVRDVIIVDLTLLGLGNLTAAQFEALYPELYYAPASVLKSNDAAALLTDGRNQWDEISEAGFIDGTTGQNASAANNWRSKGYIPMQAATEYYLYTSGTALFKTRFYDADKNYIGAADYSGSTAGGKNYIMKSPSGCAYFRFAMGQDPSAINICINLSDASFNGTYEPYWERVLALRLSELTGIPEGGTEADRVTMFPNGAGGAGSAFDSIFVENGVTKARKTMARVDLGEKGWSYLGGGFYSTLPDVKLGGSVGNVISKPYTYKGNANIGSLSDGEFAINSPFYGDRSICFKDSAYADAAAFKVAMSGVYLEYELATPIVYTDLQYADGTPFIMPQMFRTAQGGTMLIVSPEGATAPSAPFSADIIYPVDPIASSGASLKNLLEALKTATVITSYTMAFNSTTQQYEFTIVK